MSNKVLLVDDDETMRMTLEEMISSRGYETITAPNGKEALDLFKKEKFSIVITDLNMPVMDGREFIRSVKEIDNDTVFIVVSVHKEADLIIEVMKLGVYDYLIKPFSTNVLAVKIDRAVEAAELRRMKTTVASEKINKLEEQIAWAEFTDKLLKKDINRIDKSLFENLHSNFTMGAGFGTVLTLHKLIASSAEKDGDKYIIDSELFDILDQNAKLAENSIEVFSRINKIINTDVKPVEVTLAEIHDLIKKKISELDKYTSLKSQKIMLNDCKENSGDVKVRIIDEYFSDIVEELLFNAMKFSVKNSSILIIFEVKPQVIAISFISSPEENENGIRGIPVEYEQVVFEPFYRMTKKISIEYDSFESGLGLSLVEKLVEKQKSKVKITNITDHSDMAKEPVSKVMVVVEMPRSDV